MPDDLRWSWCNNNRNNMHNKWVWIILKHPHPHQPQPTLSMEKLSFTEPGPWCQKGWGVLAKATWPVPSFCWDRTTQKGAHSFGILQRLLRKLLKTENLKLSCNDWEKRGEARAAAPKQLPRLLQPQERPASWAPHLLVPEGGKKRGANWSGQV